MCFMAGANAVFTGEQMLTTPCECGSLLCWTRSLIIVAGSPWDKVSGVFLPVL